MLFTQDVAERIEREAKARHYAARAVAMSAYDIRQLPQEQAVIFVASTTGQVDSSSRGRVVACFT
jgi:sulfite reductase alpha subunit-like flavoprotein